MSRVDAILARLGGLYPKTIDLSLERVIRLMQRLGDPQEHLPPVIHVAGTNGKGSTIAFLRAFLESAGYRVHVYTSPHLVRFAERIRLAGVLIADDALSELLDEVEQRNQGEPITLFEVTTAAAFLAFSRTPADILLLETGLGGRLDATNVIAAPAVTAITPISIDHTGFLGTTIPEIAGEKAGILKPGCPAVIAHQMEAAQGVIAARAKLLDAPLFCQDEAWAVLVTATGWRYADQNLTLDLPLPRLAGRHQIGNAGLAIACLRRLPGFKINAKAIKRGLRSVDWPGRLQRLESGPLVDLLDPSWELWLDGGHNPGGAAVLAEMAKTWRDRPLYLVLGMLSNRDPAEFVAPLAPYLRAVETVTIPDEPNSHTAEACATRLWAGGIAAASASSVAAAIADIRDQAKGAGGRILICGSLYLAGRILAENGGGSAA